MALFTGRVITPIDGTSDPRYGFLFENITTPGFALGMEICADHSVAHFQPGALCSNNTAKDGYFSSNSGPQFHPCDPMAQFSTPFHSLIYRYQHAGLWLPKQNTVARH